MAIEQIIALSNRVAEAYALVELNRSYAEQATSKAQRDHLAARAAYWHNEVNTAHSNLVDALVAALPATVQPFLPVRVAGNGHLEVHARDSIARPVIVALTRTEALTIGAHLVAYAAVAHDRAGAKVTELLPTLPATPPLALTETNPVTDPADPGTGPVIGSAPVPTNTTDAHP